MFYQELHPLFSLSSFILWPYLLICTWWTFMSPRWVYKSISWPQPLYYTEKYYILEQGVSERTRLGFCLTVWGRNSYKQLTFFTSYRSPLRGASSWHLYSYAWDLPEIYLRNAWLIQSLQYCISISSEYFFNVYKYLFQMNINLQKPVQFII